MDFEIVYAHESSLINYFNESFTNKAIYAEINSFADGESFVKIPQVLSIRDKSIFLVYQFSFNTKSNINDQFFKFLLLVDFVRNAGAKRIYGVLPYLPYSREEKTFGGDFSGPIYMISKLLKAATLDNLISFDLHNESLMSSFSIPLKEVSLIYFWVELFKLSFKNLKNVCFVSPDKGRLENVKKISELLNCDFAWVEKKREGKDISVALQLNGEVKNKNVIIIDDIIDTARTAINASDLCLKFGAKKIIGFFTHAVLSKGAVERIEKSNFDKIYVTDTILLSKKESDTKIKVVSIADILCGYLKSLSIK